MCSGKWQFCWRFSSSSSSSSSRNSTSTANSGRKRNCYITEWASKKSSLLSLLGLKWKEKESISSEFGSSCYPFPFLSPSFFVFVLFPMRSLSLFGLVNQSVSQLTFTLSSALVIKRSCGFSLSVCLYRKREKIVALLDSVNFAWFCILRSLSLLDSC